MLNADQQLDELHLTAVTRQRELKTRMLIALFGAIVIGFQVSALYAVAWFGLVALTQAFDTWVWSSQILNKKGPVPRNGKRLLMLAVSVASIFYAQIAVLLWAFGGAGEKVFAFLWLAGSLLHSSLHMRHNKEILVASALPHFVFFMALPLVETFGGFTLSRTSGLIILIGAVLHFGHLITAFRTTRKLSDELLVARRVAEKGHTEAVAANDAKTNYLSSMSHEIRTPLSGIIGMAELLEKEELPDSAREKLAVLQESGDLMLRLLNDILDLSRIECGRLDLELTPVDLRKIAQRIVRSYHASAAEKGLDLTFSVEAGVNTIRLGDELRITQIFQNLVSNAIKFTKKGSVQIEIDQDVDQIVLHVRDSGIGMSQDQARVILEPFVQADTSVSRKFGGSGLGLAIVRGLVQAMGGSIDIHTMPDCGTCFTLRLPLAVDPSQSLPAAPMSDSMAPVTGLVGTRILIADDNQVNRLVLKSFLEPTGAEVVMVVDGRDAVTAAKEQAFDLILMDIEMPVMDGVTAMKQIVSDRKANQKTPIPIVAVSAHAMTHEIRSYMKEGFTDYLPKPVTGAVLYRVIRSCMPRATDAAA